MKSTGVIRRIDDLGRIVIPKEIRRNLKIRDGENMEIFIEMDAIILRKHSQIENSIEYARKLATLLNSVIDGSIIITDREKIIASSGSGAEEFVNEIISKELIGVIDNRESYFSDKVTTIAITGNRTLKGYFSVVPIIPSADSIGLILIYNQDKFHSENKLIAKFTASLISSKIDIS